MPQVYDRDVSITEENLCEYCNTAPFSADEEICGTCGCYEVCCYDPDQGCLHLRRGDMGLDYFDCC